MIAAQLFEAVETRGGRWIPDFLTEYPAKTGNFNSLDIDNPSIEVQCRSIWTEGVLEILFAVCLMVAMNEPGFYAKPRQESQPFMSRLLWIKVAKKNDGARKVPSVVYGSL